MTEVSPFPDVMWKILLNGLYAAGEEEGNELEIADWETQRKVQGRGGLQDR